MDRKFIDAKSIRKSAFQEPGSQCRTVEICCLIMLFGFIGLVCSPTAAREKPDVVVRGLYREVVTRKPLGIPRGADKAAIWPFLSKELIRTLDAGQACEVDYARKHRGDRGKPEYRWLESGLFSGVNEEALPRQAIVERTVSESDGSFLVYVRLAYTESFQTHDAPPDPENRFHWRVAAKVVSEGGRFVVDDIFMLKNESLEVRSRLSNSFEGCNSSSWVGKLAADRLEPPVTLQSPRLFRPEH